MKIRTRLSLQFLAIVTALITISLIVIYYFSAEYRSRDFYTRLKNKTLTTAKLVVELKALDNNLMQIIDRNETSIISNKNVQIFNEKGELLYNYDSSQTISVTNKILTQIIEKGEVKFSKNSYHVFGKVFTYNKNQLIIIASGVDLMGFEKLQNLQYILIAVFFSNVFLISIAGYIFSGRALAPISNIITEVDKISAKNLGKRVNEGNGMDEIALLAKTFNNMLNRIEEAFDKQKAFVANASHELRNPLTAISGQIDVTLLRKREAEDYRNVLQSIFEDIRNLSLLSNRLLSLAQVSSDNQDFNFRFLRADEILFQAREELLLGNSNYIVVIEFGTEAYEENQLKIKGNDTLLKIAFSNIMDNGCKFSNDGKVLVRLKLEKDSVVIDFVDQGIWIRPDEQKNIFEPFYRSNKMGNIKGHGVGLALVDRIIQLHSGTIQITSDPNITVFTVSIPTV